MVIWQAPAFALLIGYLLGSIPFGLILLRLAGGGDVRAIGSGNIGATNVLRSGRKGIAAATLLLDAGKGAAAVLIARALFGQHEVLAALAAFVGHILPVWLRFRGGKGIATMLGATLALDWRVGLAFAFVWIGAIALTRISAVGGMLAALISGAAAAGFGRFDLVPVLMLMALIVLWTHRDNIRRLFAGTEPRVGQKPAQG